MYQNRSRRFSVTAGKYACSTHNDEAIGVVSRLFVAAVSYHVEFSDVRYGSRVSYWSPIRQLSMLVVATGLEYSECLAKHWSDVSH